jgi:hypothetical protein
MDRPVIKEIQIVLKGDQYEVLVESVDGMGSCATKLDFSSALAKMNHFVAMHLDAAGLRFKEGT